MASWKDIVETRVSSNARPRKSARPKRVAMSLGLKIIVLMHCDMSPVPVNVRSLKNETEPSKPRSPTSKSESLERTTPPHVRARVAQKVSASPGTTSVIVPYWLCTKASMTVGTRNGDAGKEEKCVGTGWASSKSFHTSTDLGIDTTLGALRLPGCVDL